MVSPIAQFTQFFMNQGQAPWNNPKVRQAMQYAIDKDPVGAGAHRRCVQAGQPGSAAEQLGVQPRHRRHVHVRPGEGQAIVDQAGYPDGLKGVKVGKIDYDYYRPLAEAVQDMLKASNIVIELLPIPAGSIQQALYRRSRCRPPSRRSPRRAIPIRPRRCRRCSGPPVLDDNPSHVTTPGVDELLAQGAATSDQAARATAYKQVLAIVSEQALVVPLYYNSGITVFSPKLKNVVAGEQPARGADWTSEPLVYFAK